VVHSAVGNLPVCMQVGEDNLAIGAVAIQRKKGFCFSINPI